MKAKAFHLLCLATLLFTFALATGCGPSGPVNDKVNKANLDKIQLEAKLADVEALLGPGQPSEPGPSAKPEDKNLTWKKWQHSARGSEIIIGFDKTNAAAVVDKKNLAVDRHFRDNGVAGPPNTCLNNYCLDIYLADTLD